jgi:hypothetical protein
MTSQHPTASLRLANLPRNAIRRPGTPPQGSPCQPKAGHPTPVDPWTELRGKSPERRAPKHAARRAGAPPTCHGRPDPCTALRNSADPSKPRPPVRLHRRVTCTHAIAAVMLRRPGNDAHRTAPPADRSRPPWPKRCRNQALCRAAAAGRPPVRHLRRRGAHSHGDAVRSRLCLLRWAEKCAAPAALAQPRRDGGCVCRQGRAGGRCPGPPTQLPSAPVVGRLRVGDLRVRCAVCADLESHRPARSAVVTCRPPTRRCTSRARSARQVPPLR